MEKLLTKYFWVLNLIALALVAYFAATSVGELVASKVQGMLPEAAEKPKQRTSMRSLSSRSLIPPNGTPILERNIFDSTFKPLEVEQDTEQGDVADPNRPLPLVPCPQGQVTLLGTIASTGYQDWSFASISESGRTRLCRVGDQVSNRTVSGVTWRYLFLRGSSDECYVDLYPGPNAPAPVVQPTVASNEPPGDPNIASGINRVSDNEVNVDRGVLDKVLSDPTEFIKSVRVRPYRQDGKVNGFVLRRFKNDSPLGLLGAETGDIIHSVNGTELNSVDKALAVYQNLRSSNQLTFNITRRGKPMEMKVNIK